MTGDAGRGHPADRAVPRRLLHAQARGPLAGHAAPLPGPGPAVPVPRGPLHAAPRRRGLGRPERRPRARARGLQAHRHRRARPRRDAHVSRLPARRAASSGGWAPPRCGATSSKRAYVREMQRYLPEIQGDQLRFGPSGCGPRRSRTTGRSSTTSASAAAAGSSTSATPRHPRRPRAWRSAGCWPRPRSSASRSPEPAGRSGPVEGLAEVGEQVVDALDADRQADERADRPRAATRRPTYGSSPPGPR